MIRFDRVLERLLDAYGPQAWWPAGSRFEIMLGAVLVQRTTWRNAAQALAQLASEDLLRPSKLARAQIQRVQDCVRCAGFYRTKSARIIQLARYVVRHGGTDALSALATDELREKLLSVEGIGPETADAILLYGYKRPVVVVDAYLRRICGRLLGSTESADDRELRRWSLEMVEGADALGELHALVVRHGKDRCRPDPHCVDCELLDQCQTGLSKSDPELG